MVGQFQKTKPVGVVTLVGVQHFSHECCLVFARDVGEEGVTNNSAVRVTWRFVAGLGRWKSILGVMLLNAPSGATQTIQRNWGGDHECFVKVLAVRVKAGRAGCRQLVI